MEEEEVGMIDNWSKKQKLLLFATIMIICYMGIVRV